MKFYLHTNLLIVFFCLCCRYSSVKIKSELQKNVLKFSYGINYKYEGMFAHSFDRFYVVTKSILAIVDDLRLSPIKYDKECNYLHNLDDQDNDQIKRKYKMIYSCIMQNLRPYMVFYKMQIKAHSSTTHHVLKNEVDLTLPKFPKGWKSKRNFSAIISGFIGLAFEGISSFLHNKRHKALHKAVKVMSI